MMDTHASMTNLPDSAEADGHAPHAEEEHAHPTWSTYWKVALILTLITVGEVWAYYIPSFVAGRGFIPTLLILSALKFTIVVMFYMHLKMDSRFFTFLFGGPLLLAGAVMLGLMFLFGVLTLGR